MSRNTVYLYYLADPITMEPKYVGKTINTELRLKQHVHQAKKGTDEKSIWIRRLLARGLVPKIVVFEKYTAGIVWQYAERHWIDHAKKIGIRLFNRARGGIGGLDGYKHTEETILKMSAAQKGRAFSQETRLKMRAAKLGKKLSSEHKAKIAAGNTGGKRTAQQKINIANGRTGIKHSNSSRARMSAAHLGIPLSRSHAEAIARGHVGLKYKKKEREFVKDVEGYARMGEHGQG